MRFAECLLAISAILLTYFGAEAAFSLVGLRYVPLRLQGDLPEDVGIFAQSSKSGTVPRDHVLLLGDSYAQGFGDWLLDASPYRNGPFHSAHVINRISGHDVITLGMPGGGSAEGLAVAPAIAYERTKHAWHLRLSPPYAAVVYFYEGNDLNDNIQFLNGRVGNLEAADLPGRVDQAIAAYVSAMLVHIDWRQHFPLFRFSDRMARRTFADLTSAQPTRGPDLYVVTRATQTDPPNLVEVAGAPVELPGNLQSPAMELTEPELERTALVFERSLAFLRKLLPGVPVLVVYLPSPLSSYQLSAPEVSIQQYVPDRATRHLTESVSKYSNAVCLLIRAAAIGEGAGFLDLRPAIRTAGRRDLLHGPRDFKHFNRNGMEVLGQTVAGRIDQPS